MKANIAEFFGTFWLVLGGCGAAVLAAHFPDSTGQINMGIGFVGVALAFGLTVLTMIYAVGPISGGHFNPAVTFGLWAGGRIEGKKVLPYIVSQILGAILAASVLYVIATGNGSEIGSFASNGYGDHSPGGYGLSAALLCETVMSFIFIFIIMGATSKRAPAGFAGIAIGLALTLIHLISIPVTNTSVNPARSISQALFVGDYALSQLWAFLIFPIIGGILGGLVYNKILD